MIKFNGSPMTRNQFQSFLNDLDKQIRETSLMKTNLGHMGIDSIKYIIGEFGIEGFRSFCNDNEFTTSVEGIEYLRSLGV